MIKLKVQQIKKLNKGEILEKDFQKNSVNVYFLKKIFRKFLKLLLNIFYLNHNLYIHV